MLLTRKQAYAWLDNSVGKQYNMDNYAGFQCYDYSKAYIAAVTGYLIHGLYAKNIHTDNKEIFDKIGAKITENYDSYLPERGEIVVFPGIFGNGAGHTAVVNRATLTQFEVIEQNWNNQGWTDGVESPGWGPEKATRRWHYYTDDMVFIRLKYAETKVSVAKQAAKKLQTKKAIADAKIKPKKILLVAGHGYNDPGAVNEELGLTERDFIRKNITPSIKKHLQKAGHTVDLYGGEKQNQNMYIDSAYGQRNGNFKDYGIYWAKGQKYDVIVEFHLDAAGATASGGHVIKNAYAADSIDKGLQSVLEDTVGTIRGITTRKDLLHCNLAYDLNINYRLIELGFITSNKDMKYIQKNIDVFTEKLADAINTKPIYGTKKTEVKNKPKNESKVACPSGYKLNKKNVPYKKETGKYTVTVAKGNNIRAGYTTKSKIVGVLENGKSVIYDSAYIYDGLRWISYIGFSGKRRFIATGEVDKKGNRKNSYGKFSEV